MKRLVIYALQFYKHDKGYTRNGYARIFIADALASVNEHSTRFINMSKNST